jgi:catechol 2,3-dioxygenase-like lactoylglutathione lyase family enzyme
MIKELAFVVYAVTDIARSREFYEKTLGLRVAETFGDGWIEFGVAGATFAITNSFPSTPQSSVAFEVDDLDDDVARLKAAGVPFEGGIGDFPGCRMQLIRDPDGHTICLHQRKK